jgi:phospholipid-translocating ATPase
MEPITKFDATPRSLINLLIMAAMATVCAIVDSVLEHRYYPKGAPWLYADNTSGDNPSINGLVTWAFSLLTLVFLIATFTL